jgi:hypothetical protein
MATQCSFAALFAEAVAESQRAAAHAENARVENAALLAQRIKDAQEALVNDILENAPSKIRESASQGRHSADVLNFNGSDTVGDLSTVFLVRGPRRGTTTEAPHVESIVPRLRRMMHPFEVRHEWDVATGGNRVVVSWAEHP